MPKGSPPPRTSVAEQELSVEDWNKEIGKTFSMKFSNLSKNAGSIVSRTMAVAKPVLSVAAGVLAVVGAVAGDGDFVWIDTGSSSPGSYGGSNSKNKGVFLMSGNDKSKFVKAISMMPRTQENVKTLETLTSWRNRPTISPKSIEGPFTGDDAVHVDEGFNTIKYDQRDEKILSSDDTQHPTFMNDPKVKRETQKYGPVKFRFNPENGQIDIHEQFFGGLGKLQESLPSGSPLSQLVFKTINVQKEQMEEHAKDLADVLKHISTNYKQSGHPKTRYAPAEKRVESLISEGSTAALCKAAQATLYVGNSGFPFAAKKGEYLQQIAGHQKADVSVFSAIEDELQKLSFNTRRRIRAGFPNQYREALASLRVTDSVPSGNIQTPPPPPSSYRPQETSSRGVRAPSVFSNNTETQPPSYHSRASTIAPKSKPPAATLSNRLSSLPLEPLASGNRLGAASSSTADTRGQDSVPPANLRVDLDREDIIANPHLRKLLAALQPHWNNSLNEGVSIKENPENTTNYEVWITPPPESGREQRKLSLPKKSRTANEIRRIYSEISRGSHPTQARLETLNKASSQKYPDKHSGLPRSGNTEVPGKVFRRSG